MQTKQRVFGDDGRHASKPCCPQGTMKGVNETPETGPARLVFIWTIVQ